MITRTHIHSHWKDDFLFNGTRYTRSLLRFDDRIENSFLMIKHNDTINNIILLTSFVLEWQFYVFIYYT